MDILINSNIQQATPDYYINSKDYKGSKLYFNDNAAAVDYCILRKNTTDGLWYVVTSGDLKGYVNDGHYLYQFDYDKYISFDNNKTINPNDYTDLDFRFQGNSSSQMYFLSSVTGDSVQDNIDDNYFTLLSDGRILVNDIADVASYNCDLLVQTNFWNREDGTIYNYPIQNKVEKNSYFPITIYFDYDAWVILKDINGNVIKQMSVGNGSDKDYSTEFIWIPENCESIGIYEYNSNGYNEITNGVQPNLLDNSQAPEFSPNQGAGFVTIEPMSDELEPYVRYTGVDGNRASIFGAGYIYNDYKALYVASYDVRVQTDESIAKIACYMHSDFFDSVNSFYNLVPYTWNRCYTQPFSIPLVDAPNGLGYLIINNDSDDYVDKWIDIKNVKIEKVKFNKYVNYIPRGINSNAYGFGIDRIYLEAGKTYSLQVGGNNANATLGRQLMVEVFDFVDFYFDVNTGEFPSNFDKTMTFTAPHTQSYDIRSYYYPSNPNTSGSVYLDYYYIYEGTVDPGYQSIVPTDWIPSANDMESQTNYKSFNKTVSCPGPISNDYYYLDNNSVMDKLSCKANSFDLESVEKEYVKLGNKNFNNKTTVKKQIVQNTGYQLDEKQVYSLNKSPLVYKIEPKDYMIHTNYVSNTSTTYTLNTPSWVQLPLRYKLTPGKTYYLQGEIVQNSTSNSTAIVLNNGDYTNDAINLTLNSSFVCTPEMSLRTHFSFGNQIAYSPLVIRNLMITEGNQARVFEQEVLPYFEIKNYNVENTSFDGYQHKLLSEKNFEIILTDIESVTKRNNIKTTFFE